MEDIITIAIILIGVGIKIYGAFKKNKPEVEESDNAPSWDEFLDEVENSDELQEAVESDPELQRAYQAAQARREAQKQALLAAQAERDAALLEQQRMIAEMAARAAAANQANTAEDSSEIYAQSDTDSPTEESNPGDWAELIRNNRTEAVVISEILAPPAALRR